MSDAVTLEGPDTRLITAYATRAEAVQAIEQEVDRLQAAGATISGDLSSGSTARWEEHDQPVSLRLILGEGRRQPRKTIRQLREERGWTQETLARRLGVGQGAISAWERGERVPRQRSILRLAELFGIRVEDIALGLAE